MEPLAYKPNSNSVTDRNNESCSDDTSGLKKVKPQKFLFHSFQCQEQAAYIRNRLIESIKEKDSAMVAFRYLQSRQAGFNVRFETNFDCVVTALASYFFTQAPLLPFAVSVVSMPQVFINIRNSFRYGETTEIANSFLKKSLTERTYEKVDELKYCPSGLEKLFKVLSESEIDVENLKEKLINKGILSDA